MASFGVETLGFSIPTSCPKPSRSSFMANVTTNGVGFLRRVHWLPSAHPHEMWDLVVVSRRWASVFPRGYQWLELNVASFGGVTMSGIATLGVGFLTSFLVASRR
jgi:hypothetical protein